MKNIITKEELCKILEYFYVQILEISLCLDSLDAIKEIGEEKIKIAKNFFFVTHRSLIIRYSVELTKLTDKNEERSIYRIMKLCSQNAEWFDSKDELENLCKQVKKELKKYENIISNLKGRRNKTYVHSDEDYYYFNQKAIDEFPLKGKEQEINQIVNLLYNFALVLQKEIHGRYENDNYPRNYDDVKKLFNIPTNDEIGESEILKLWNRGANNDKL